jgi:two-component sensor histidine kinase
LRLKLLKAIPCALLVNEVVTNAYKHAFKHHEEGEIKVKLRKNNGDILIDIRDNGVGLQDDFMEETSSSIGMTLIKLLKQQLEGEMEFHNQNGTHFVFTFKKADVKGSASSFTEN